MLCAKFGRNWLSGSGEEHLIYSLFLNYLPLEKGGALHLNKLESPLTNDALCKVWLKFAQRFWRRFFSFVNVFSLSCSYLPWENGEALHLNKLEFPLPKSLVEIRPVILEKMNM